MAMNVDVSSHRIQLVLAALGASVATAGLLTAYQQHSRHQKRRQLELELKQSLQNASANGVPAPRPRKPETEEGVAEITLSARRGEEYEYDEELIREQLARNYAFFGEEGMARIRKGSVVVVGCGGVGSWAAIMLVRSYAPQLCTLCQTSNEYALCDRGISKIRLVDFDQVTLSSLNRHATATLADVGTPKVRSIERAIKQIARWVDVDARIDIWRKEQGGDLLEGVDWVIGKYDPPPRNAAC